ncbi:MAG: SGNH/GDSL hydrolase family protein [Nocardioides sp.]|nr:SGNH/GDSL hydrolase family protein [Nocardioides sp.]
MSSAAERARLAGLVLLTVATIAVIAFEFSGDSRDAGGPGTGAPTAEPTPTGSSDPPLSVPSEADVLFIGDDWMAGAGASAPSGGFAHRTAKLLGWDYRIDAVPGSGWAHGAADVPGSMFLDRVIRMPSGAEFAPDLVVISAQMVSPATPAEIRRLMRQTVSVLLDRTPDSVVAVVLPYGSARASGWCEPLESDRVLCIDTQGEQWLPEADRASYLAADGLVPNNAGHERFAELLATDLRRDLTFL